MQLGRYELRRLLGKGGMGAVYLAYDSQLDRQIALKLPHLRDEDTSHDRERFLREARAAAGLTHPNLCAIHDVGETDGLPRLVMDFIAGGNLAELVLEQPLPARQAASFVRTIAEAVQHAHDHGVVVLHGRGRVRLGDEEHAIGFGDVVYVAPHEPHAFEADGPEPLGFLCVVPARR